jgi:hypothetical protein
VQNNYCTSKSLCFGKKKCQSCCSCEKRPGPIKSRRWTTDRTGFMAGLAQRTYLHSLGNKRSPFQFPHHSEPPCKGFAGQPNRLPPFRRVPALEEIDVDMKPLLPYPDVARNAQGTPPLPRSRRPRLLPRFSRAPRPGFPPILHGISLLLVAKFLNLICGADVVAKDQPFSIAAYISSGPVCDSPSVVQIVRSLFVVVRCGAVRMESGFRLDLCAPC